MDGVLNHRRRFSTFSNSTTVITTGPSPSSAPTSSPSSSTTPSHITSLPISSSLSVAPFAASPAAPVPNPIASIPTTSYTGQALLTATCAVPQFTAFPLSDGSYLAVPVIGCAEQNPQCCPSLSETSNAPTIPTASIIPLSEANSALVSALNAASLTLCPADYISTAGNCCPVGFSLYNQLIIGQTPCYSVLTQTLSIPPAASEQISSLSSIIAASATASTPTVSVRNDEIFALSISLQNGTEPFTNNNGGLSLGAKIGIGVGVGLGVIISIMLIACLFFRIRRKRHVKGASKTSDIPTASTGTSTAEPPKTSLVSTATGPISNPTRLQEQGHTNHVDKGHISDPGGEQLWSSRQQQYIRTSPPRTDLRPMRMVHGGGQAGGQTIYSELPAGEEETGWHGQHQRQTYDQAGAGYSQSGGAAYIAYPPPDRVELGNATPRPPRWRQ